MSDLSWLNPTPHAIAVYASRPLSPVAAQHSLPSGRYSLLGPDFHRLDRTSLRLAHSLDHLVGAHKQSGWHSKAERLGSLEIDEQFDFRRLLHRQIGRLLALENPAGIDTGLAVHIGNAASITQQPTSGGELTPLVDRGQGVADGQCGELLDPTVEEGIGADHETGRLQLGRGCEHRIELRFAARMQNMELDPERASRHLHLF